MAYEQIEDLANRGQARQVSIITTANIVGLIMGVLLAWRLTLLLGITGEWFSTGYWVQCGIVVAAGALGVVLTIRWSGLSLLDRLTLFGGYQARRLAGDTILTPESPISTPQGSGVPTLMRDGHIVVQPYQPQTHQGNDHA